MIANYPGRDRYVGAWVNGELCGYGMLRGWDAGFSVPSLGIYVIPRARGSGLAEELMRHLHNVAAEAAPRVRLRVTPDNLPARALYERVGYVFDGTVERGELVGVKTLSTTLTAAPHAHSRNK